MRRPRRLCQLFSPESGCVKSKRTPNTTTKSVCFYFHCYCSTPKLQNKSLEDQGKDLTETDCSLPLSCSLYPNVACGDALKRLSFCSHTHFSPSARPLMRIAMLGGNMRSLLFYFSPLFLFSCCDTHTAWNDDVVIARQACREGYRHDAPAPDLAIDELIGNDNLSSPVELSSPNT